MLVLQRKVGQQIVINNNIVVTVLSTIGDRVRLGFDAPRDVTILRKEVYEALRKEIYEADERKKPDQEGGQEV